MIFKRVIKSKILGWPCYVVRIEEGRGALKILTDITTGKRP
jgi:hypothetical protein